MPLWMTDGVVCAPSIHSGAEPARASAGEGDLVLVLFIRGAYASVWSWRASAPILTIVAWIGVATTPYHRQGR
jgi:hypothetical protein